MIKFRCPVCSKKIGVPDEYAEKRVKCPTCNSAAQVPSPDSVSTPAGVGLHLPDNDSYRQPADNIWSDDLFNQPAESPEQPADQNQYEISDSPDQYSNQQATRPHSKAVFKSSAGNAGSMSRFPLAIGGSFAGVVMGGALWAAIVYFTDYELGIIAWLIGVLAGFGAAIFTPERSTRLGAAAAAMAIIGILIGKILILQWVLTPSHMQELAVESSAEVVNEMIENPMVMLQVASEYMIANGQLQEDFSRRLMDFTEAKTNDPSTKIPPEIAAGVVKVTSFLASWPEDQKRAALEDWLRVHAGQFTNEFMQNASWTEKITTTLSFWDILWVFLALSTAYKIASGATAN